MYTWLHTCACYQTDKFFSYGTDHIFQTYNYFHWPSFFKKGNVICFVHCAFTVSYKYN